MFRFSYWEPNMQRRNLFLDIYLRISTYLQAFTPYYTSSWTSMFRLLQLCIQALQFVLFLCYILAENKHYATKRKLMLLFYLKQNIPSLYVCMNTHGSNNKINSAFLIFQFLNPKILNHLKSIFSLNARDISKLFHILNNCPH